MSFQLPTAEEKHSYVLKQFDRIAKKYDLMNDLISVGMHRGWKNQAIAELMHGTNLKGDSNKHFLDVCTGTGDLALLIAASSGFEGKVTGLDFSSEMLNVARQRAANKAASLKSTVEFQQGDAQALPFANDTFDGAIISFGLRNLTDLQKGLNEMARVVKPGGKIINLDLGQPTMPVFTPLFFFFFDNVVPMLGEIIQQDRQAYTYLPESRKKYPNPQKLTEMFEAAGLIDVRWKSLACGSVAMHIGTAK